MEDELFPQEAIADLPESVDWRDEGVVTMVSSPMTPFLPNLRSDSSLSMTPPCAQVRNQGACGSCWAFAASSVMGSYAKINNMWDHLTITTSAQDPRPGGAEPAAPGGVHPQPPEVRRHR